MKLKSRIFLASAFFALVAGFFLASSPDTALGQGFTYTPLEKIPGASTATTFPQYIEGIYKFGIWTVGIAALFMLSVGGFVYMTSGGNTATLSRAKGYIADALIGLILALLAYLILNVINPDLVNLNLSRFNDVGGTVPKTITTDGGNTGRPKAGVGCVTTPSDASPITAAMKTKSQKILDEVSVQYGGGECRAADGPLEPADNFKEQASGQPMTKCYDRCRTSECRGVFYCSAKTSMSEVALDVIINTNNALKAAHGVSRPFVITSVAGGDHSASSAHYHGKGIDVVGNPSAPIAWKTILKAFLDNGAGSGSFCEDGSGAAVDCLGGATFPNGGIGDHLHIVLP